MFNLTEAVARWRARLHEHHGFHSSELDELESHLWDAVEARLERGLDVRDAFFDAARSLGADAALADEYRKVRPRRFRRPFRSLRLPSPVMVANYLTVALRHMYRQKGYTFISVAGLAVGLACCLLIFLYVRHEWRYDRYHAHVDRIYRVVKGTSANSPERWAPALEAEFPDVERAVRLMGNFSRALLRVDAPSGAAGDAFVPAPGGLYADAGVFDIFSWPLRRGDPRTALAAPFSVVLTESLALKHFGAADPLGRTITLGGIANDAEQRTYTVTGVMADVPRASHVHFDYLVSFATVETLDEAGDWGTPLSWTNRMAKTYLLLNEQRTPDRLETRLPEFLRRHVADEQYDVTDVRLQPLSTIHLTSALRSEFEPGGTLSTVYLFSALAGFILLIACINFMNLATARSQQRAREVGLRKALGAHRGQLAGQFLGEAVLLCLLALGLAVLLLEALLPVFGSLTGVDLAVDYLGNAWLMALFLGIAVVIGLLAGSYPALVLSAFRPIATLKAGAHPAAHGARMRKGLVVFQFGVSIALLAGTAVIYDQLTYLRTRDLGFDDEQVIVLPIGHSRTLSEQADVLKAELLRHPGVLRVSASHSIPGQWLNGFSYRLEGAPPDEQVSLGDVSVDFDFAETFGLELIAGRSFAADLAGDSTAFVLNESAVRALGWATPDDAVGQTLEWVFPLGFQGPVIGVVKDFHFGSLHDAIPPIVFHISRFGSNFVAARLRPDDVPATLSFLEQTWRRFETAYPFDYFFVDRQFASLYEAEARLAKTFACGAGLAIVLACLGLFGLAAFTAERRTREIGIRKVLGASAPDVALLFLKDFLQLVALAFLVACPVAYLALHRWLQAFAYRIDIRPGEFLMAGLIALGVTILTVSYQAIKAARIDPVRSLRAL